MDLSFYNNKRILITGHTGFKGSWMCMVLKHLGAVVTGYALDPPTNPSMFEICDVADDMSSITGDIRDLRKLKAVFDDTRPEIVVHMAAQPIVRESYKEPVYTYDVNVMGTVNVLEYVRTCSSVRSFVNVTTDKVYLNDERNEGFKEDDMLNGSDPYSNSKSCSELVTSAYRKSFFNTEGDGRMCAISTCRAGNVIGGGDFAKDRIIPDCIRAASTGKDIIIRNPHSIRPYQHVLEPVIAYLYIAMKQYEDPFFAGAYNIGPDDRDCYTTGELARLFCEEWNMCMQTDVSWIDRYDGGPHEDSFLRLNNTRVKKTFGWEPKWDVRMSMRMIMEWTKEYLKNGNVKACTYRQIDEYLQ